MAKTKIAILGGGIGALAAAFDITEQDPSGSQFDVTLYQVGWRLGGKCAVGWSCGKPKVRYEHGLHVWAGFYDNGFDLLQRCYGAMEAPPFSNWRDAFEPVDNCWIEEWFDGAWKPWRQYVPPNDLTPGLGQVSAPYQLWTRLVSLVSSAFYNSDLRSASRDYMNRSGLGRAAVEPAETVKNATSRLKMEGFGLSGGEKNELLNLLQLASDELLPEGLATAPTAVRHAAIFVNMGLALLIGMLDGDVLAEGFDRLDAIEWSDWMRQYGAWDITLESGLVKGFYDYIFGAPGGVKSVGAGTATRALLRLLFTYKGSFFYAMNQTMGELLIAPLYKVLSARGVKFEFFHRVDKLILSPDGRCLDKIEIGIQAEPIATNYDPLISVGNVTSWPISPIYDRLKQGSALKASGADLESPENGWKDVDKKTLLRGQDPGFDVAVLGISVGALSTICSDLADRLPAWRDMLSKVKTTPTMAMQLWMSRSAEDFGWPYHQTIVTALAEPLTTWGDNSQLIAQEQWDVAAPLSLAYFVGNFEDLGLSLPPAQQLGIAQDLAAAWRSKNLPYLWPGYDDKMLMLPPYVRVNINPSDRYVLSVPQSVESRLRPDGSGVENLVLAGDWVRIALNAGCVEQAVLGGRATARAITGIDMSSNYDNDFPSGSGTSSAAISALGVFSLLPNLGRVAFAGAGSVDACCIVGYRPRGEVEKLLPIGLKLGPEPPAHRGLWPLALVFSRHSGVRPGIAPPIGGLRYDEFLIAVPSVYHVDRQPFQGPFCYMPVILLDSLLPLILGAGFYGLKKRNARIMARTDSFNIRFDEGQISASLRDEGPPGMIQDFPGLTTIRKMMEQAIVGETSSGFWVYSYLEYNLDAAEFQPIRGKVRSTGKRAFEFNFDPIVSNEASSGTEQARRSGAETGDLTPPPLGFRMLTNWQFTYPIVRGQYEPSPTQPSVRAFASTMSERFRNRFPSFGRFPPR